MNSRSIDELETQIVGCLLGTAVGDALGLPYEQVSRQRAERLLGPPDRYRFFFGRGMISDDTEHSCLVAQALIASGGQSEVFVKNLRLRMKWWFATMPAGLGKATLRACLRMWLGFSADRCGVESAGNGPAMRSSIIGASVDEIDQLQQLVRLNSRITHTDPKAEFGAIAVALAAMHSRQKMEVNGEQYIDELTRLLDDRGAELIKLLKAVVASVDSKQSTTDYAAVSGWERGVSGYTYHTVPIGIHAWLSHPTDFRAAVTAAINCGGDADTTAAIVGGIVGARVGEAGIPLEWIANLKDYPRSISWIRRLGEQLACAAATTDETHKRIEGPIEANFILVLLRNMLFLVVVLFHGFRRLLPPY